jgi:20S proteasome alpha/beta subunit
MFQGTAMMTSRSVGFGLRRVMGGRTASFQRPPAVASIAARTYSATGASAGAVDWHGTTIVCVRKDGKVCMAGDGQVSQGSTVVKGNARKVRRIGDNILVGFAGKYHHD